MASINTSGHKYGRVYPGVGWVVWRDEAGLPDYLVFRVNYLGGEMPTFAINFSRPAPRSSPSTTSSSGWAARATAPSSSRAATPRPGWPPSSRRSLSPAHHRRQPTARVHVHHHRRARLDVYDVSRRLRERGSLIPAYSFPRNRQDLDVLRVVVRTGSVDLLELLLEDIERLLPELEAQSGPLAGPHREAFHH